MSTLVCHLVCKAYHNNSIFYYLLPFSHDSPAFRATHLNLFLVFGFLLLFVFFSLFHLELLPSPPLLPCLLSNANALDTNEEKATIFWSCVVYFFSRTRVSQELNASVIRNSLVIWGSLLLHLCLSPYASYGARTGI